MKYTYIECSKCCTLKSVPSFTHQHTHTSIQHSAFFYKANTDHYRETNQCFKSNPYTDGTSLWWWCGGGVDQGHFDVTQWWNWTSNSLNSGSAANCFWLFSDPLGVWLSSDQMLQSFQLCYYICWCYTLQWVVCSFYVHNHCKKRRK